MSPELETLDQLQGGDLSLDVIRGLYPDDARFKRAMTAMLVAGELRLLDSEGRNVSLRELAEILDQPSAHRPVQTCRFSITDLGAARID